MCGMLAMYSRVRPLSTETLCRATAALRHRGPDGVGTWSSRDGRVGLGHVRLAVIDPAGHQPIASEDEQRRIVVNGEFYGFEAVRRELENAGHRFRTRSDSEIALHLYEDLGPSCLERLRGEFAFILWDEPSRTLFAARDRFGIKPLFYAEVAGVLYLASEAKALFAAGVAPAWDEEGVFQTLHACPLPERSLFAGIRQVPPGHFLVAGDQPTRLERYWDIRASGRVAPAPAESVEQIRHLLDEAVRLRMRADVPVGCLLSGGLDSSSVLGLAAAHSDKPVVAFTIAFDHRDYDESAGAREMVRHAGADLRIVPVSDQDLTDHFAPATWHGEMVQYNAHGTARYLLSRAVRAAGYKSVLAGEGADELFVGYEFLRAAVPRAGSRARVAGWLALGLRLLRPPTRAQRDLAQVSPWLGRLSRLVGLSPLLLTRLAGGLGFLRALLSPAFLARFARHDPYREFYDRCAQQAGLSAWEPARQLVYLWLRSMFVNYHLAADRLDMAHGVEVRLPFLDHVLFEHTNQLPLSRLVNGGREKALLREAARPFISEGVYQRTKKPFWAPPVASRAGSRLHEMTQDTLRGSGLDSLPFFDRPAVQRLLDRLPALDAAERAAIDPLLMTMVSVCVLDRGLRSAATKD